MSTDIKKYEDLKTPEELLEYMNENIEYGWLDYNGESHINNMKGIRTLYRTMSMDEIMDLKIGTCIEQTLFQKHFFDKIGFPAKMYSLRVYGLEEQTDDEVKMHCFTIFKRDGKYYHFEHANPDIPGIYEYTDEEEAIVGVSEYYLKRDNGKSRRLNQFDEIPANLSFMEVNEYLNQLELQNVKKR